MDKPSNELKDEDRPTLRDWFAVQFLHGSDHNLAYSWQAPLIAQSAYWVADAMLSERKKGGE